MTRNSYWLASRIVSPLTFTFVLILGLFEGVDIASVGLAMSRMTKELALDSSEGGYCASAGILGLTVGAAFGGRLADFVGYRSVMLISISLLGFFSLISAFAWDFHSMLAARLCTGLGIGGLIPILMALANTSAAPRFRSTAVGMLLASGGVGASLASFVSLYPDWRAVFYFGGTGPLLSLPLMLAFLPRDLASSDISDDIEDGPLSFLQALFGSDRWLGTLLIWILVFFISLVSFVMVSWLPTLLIQKGATEAESHAAMVLYFMGNVTGNVVGGAILDRGLPRATYVMGYLGAAACIVGLASPVAVTSLYPLAAATAFFIFSSQLVTFSLTPNFYPGSVRVTGIGAMVAVGRSGSIVGPLLVGLLLMWGLSASVVLLILVPICLVSLVLALVFGRCLWSGSAGKI